MFQIAGLCVRWNVRRNLFANLPNDGNARGIEAGADMKQTKAQAHPSLVLLPGNYQSEKCSQLLLASPRLFNL
jgi:hypothetical protein